MERPAIARNLKKPSAAFKVVSHLNNYLLLDFIIEALHGEHVFDAVVLMCL